MADSIRESLTKAFAAAETEPANEPDKSGPAAPTGEAAPQDAAPIKTGETQATTPTGAQPDKEPAKEPAKPPVTAAPTDPKTATTPGGGTNPPQPPPSPADQAPGSWKPTEKAEWDKIPPNARAAIKRREAEASRAFTASTEARRHTEEYQKVLHPFEPLIQAKGITDPLNQVIKPILQIRAALEIGTPQQKAMLIANMVRDFGVDVGHLDAAIVQNVNNPGAPAPVHHAPPPPPSLRANPELQPLFALAEQLEQRREAAAAEAIQSVESLPHFDDLREDMADIMARAAERNRTVTIKQAYDWALAQSEYAGSAPVAPTAPTVTPSEAAAILARSRKAASSVTGAPSGAPGKKPTTLREQIASAMDLHAS